MVLIELEYLQLIDVRHRYLVAQDKQILSCSVTALFEVHFVILPLTLVGGIKIPPTLVPTAQFSS